MKVHAELVKLRDEKLLRFIGLTTHVAFETVHEMIKTDGFDQVLLAYGYVRKGMDTMLSNRKIEYPRSVPGRRPRARHGDRGHEGAWAPTCSATTPRTWSPDYDADAAGQDSAGGDSLGPAGRARVDAQHRRVDAQRHRPEPGRGPRRYDVHQSAIANCWPTFRRGCTSRDAVKAMKVS